MSLIIIAIICLGIYYLYGFITDQETKRQRKNDPKRKESLEFYTTQTNLFLQYKNYLYDNIDNFKKIPSRESIRKKPSIFNIFFINLRNMVIPLRFLL